jgi:hypothetical protein
MNYEFLEYVSEVTVVNMPGSIYFPHIKYIRTLKYDGSGHFCQYVENDLE